MSAKPKRLMWQLLQDLVKDRGVEIEWESKTGLWIITEPEYKSPLAMDESLVVAIQMALDSYSKMNNSKET